MEGIRKFFAAIAGSKKAVAMIVGIVFALFVKPLADRVGVEVSKEDVYLFVGLIITFIVGQGIADTGKEAAKIVAAAPPAPAPTSNATTNVTVESPSTVSTDRSES